MGQYVFRRLLQALPSFPHLPDVFMLIRMSGDPMSMYAQASSLTEADRERIIKEHGWDQPKIVQYVYWLRDIARGDLGSSLYTYQPVTQMIWEKLPNTLILMGTVFMSRSLFPSRWRSSPPYDNIRAGLCGHRGVVLRLRAAHLLAGAGLHHDLCGQVQRMGPPLLPAGGMYDLVEGPLPPGPVKHLCCRRWCSPSSPWPPTSATCGPACSRCCTTTSSARRGERIAGAVGHLASCVPQRPDSPGDPDHDEHPPDLLRRT